MKTFTVYMIIDFSEDPYEFHHAVATLKKAVKWCGKDVWWSHLEEEYEKQGIKVPEGRGANWSYYCWGDDGEIRYAVEPVEVDLDDTELKELCKDCTV